jgi:hypothetical protein
VESEVDSQEEASAELFPQEDRSTILPNRELSSIELQERRMHEKSSLDKVLEVMFEGSPSEDEGDRTLTEFTAVAGNLIY